MPQRHMRNRWVGLFSRDLHPLLDRSESGGVTIAYRRTLVWLLIFGSIFASAQLLLTYFLGLNLYSSKLAAIGLSCLGPPLLHFYYSLRVAKGEPLRQFSIRGLIIATVYCCTLVAAWASVMQFETGYRNPSLEPLQSKIMQVVKEGSATLERTGDLYLRVDRPSFNDEDFSKLGSVCEPLADRKYSRSLELNGTDIGDASIRSLAYQTRLEILCLRGTRVTDASLESLLKLSSLKVLDLRETKMSPECVEKLKRALRNADVYSDHD